MYSYSWRPTVKENWQEGSSLKELSVWIDQPWLLCQLKQPLSQVHAQLSVACTIPFMYRKRRGGGLKGEGSVLHRSKIMRQLRVNDLLIGLNRGCALRSAVCMCAVTVTSQDQWWSLVDPPSPCLWSGTEHNSTQRNLKPRRFAYFRNDCTIGDFPLVFLT